MNRQQQLAAIFADTQEMIASTPQLKAASDRTAREARLFEASDWPVLAVPSRGGEIRVSGRRSFEAAQTIAAERPGARIAVHNFASAVNPGGGVTRGATAQEECLCRCSTLYPSLNQRKFWDSYYLPNRNANDFMATDACIWSPGVVICKSDTSLPVRIGPEQWVTVDVVTCAAPNLYVPLSILQNRDFGHGSEVSPERLYEVHLRRARHLLTVAASQGADCLVLGAFGCGAFCNDPHLVARAWHAALDELRGHFDLIEFAIFYQSYETENYQAFAAEFGA